MKSIITYLLLIWAVLLIFIFRAYFPLGCYNKEACEKNNFILVPSQNKVVYVSKYDCFDLVAQLKKLLPENRSELTPPQNYYGVKHTYPANSEIVFADGSKITTNGSTVPEPELMKSINKVR